MPWRRATVMDQRIRFVLLAKRKEKPLSRLCEEFGISRPTGYLWLRRYEEAGSVTGLAEKSRRPNSSPHQTEAGVENAVVELRKSKGWGARKVSVVLGRDGVKVLPITAHRILARHGLIERDGSERKAIKRFERSECNQMYQMDFKGEYRVKNGWCFPLSFVDDHSRYLVGLWTLGSTSGNGVQASLKRHFQERGVPLSVLTDHGTPWFSGTNGHGLTWLSVWMIKQGIRLLFAGRGHPQTNGKVERFHRTLKDRTKHRGLPATLDEWQGWADVFRKEYNEVRPHEAIGMKTPVEVYNHDNLRPYQENPPEWDYSGGRVLKLNTRGMLDYSGRRYFVCEALAGEWVRVDELDHLLVVTFRHTTIREIDLQTRKSVPVILDAQAYFGPRGSTLKPIEGISET